MTSHANRSRRRMGTAALHIASGLALAGSPAGSWAQEIEEITVTARKVEESLKEVPLAITAFSSETIEAAGITSLGDVADLTPGLTFFNPFGENLPVPIIRGVAQTDIFGETNAGIFVDGVYIAAREGLNFSQLDVERIEVVKGPQSALYGRTAFSGAINYVTKRPSEVFEAKTEVEAGNDGKQKGMALVSGPIFGDSLRGRLAALYDEWDGSYDNSEAPENDIGGYRYRSYQGSLVWEPADSLEIYANLYSSNDEIDDAAIVPLAANCENRVDEFPDDVRLLNYCGQIPDLDELPGLSDDDSMPKIARALGEDRDLLRSSLNITWDLADVGTITSLTGYSNTDQESLSDFGHFGSNIPFLYCQPATLEPPEVPNSCQGNPATNRFFTGILDKEFGDETEEWSQELRFTSPQDRAFRYTVGGYVYDRQEESFDGNTISTQPLPAADIGLPPTAAPDAPNFAIGTAIFYRTFTPDGGLDPLNRVLQKDDTQSWAGFSAVDFDFTDRLTGRAELRYTNTTKEVRSLVYEECGFDASVCGDDIYDLRVTAPLPPNPDNPGFGSAKASVRFESVTGRVGLDFKINPEWMVYGSIATGDKPGGLRLISATVLVPGGATQEELIENSWETEEITAYEVGVKGRTADGRVGLDLSVFFNDWREIVLRQIVDESPETGAPLEQPTAFNFNAGDAEVWGWEATTDMAFTDNLTGRFTVSWTDAELTDARQDTFGTFPSFRAPGCEDYQQDPDPTTPDRNEAEEACIDVSGVVTGNQLLRQAEWKWSASLSYSRPIAGDWEWFTRSDLSWVDEIFLGNDNQSWLPSHTYLNMRLGVKSARYSVELWGRNLFNDDNPIAAFRDIYWSNTDDIPAGSTPTEPSPSFDKFVPLRYSITYPSLRTYGITAKVRFGGAEQ